MIRNIIFVGLTVLTLLLPSLAAAEEPYTAEGTGTPTTARACRDPLVLEQGGCANLEARSTLSGTFVGCLPEDDNLQWFKCTVEWTLTITSSGASSGCIEGTSSVLPYLLACTNVPLAPNKAVSQPQLKDYRVERGTRSVEEWVRACVDPGTPIQRCSDAVPVYFVFDTKTSASLGNIPEQVEQVVEVVTDIASNPPVSH